MTLVVEASGGTLHSAFAWSPAFRFADQLAPSRMARARVILAEESRQVLYLTMRHRHTHP